MQIGHTYTLPVLERRQDALFLDGGKLGPVPLPLKEGGSSDVGDKLSIGDIKSEYRRYKPHTATKPPHTLHTLTSIPRRPHLILA